MQINIKKYTYIVLIITGIFIFINFSEAATQNLELKGTIFTKSFKPIAIIKDVTTGKISMYELGESIGNAKITGIERGEVILQNKSARYVLVLPGGSVAQPGAINIGINKKDATFYIPRADINKALLKVPQIMRDVKIMPNFSKGRPQGIKLCKVKEGSVFEKAGVTAGDVVKSVNGMTLNTPYQVFNAYKKLKDDKNFKVEILRDNKPVALNYIIE